MAASGTGGAGMIGGVDAGSCPGAVVRAASCAAMAARSEGDKVTVVDAAAAGGGDVVSTRTDDAS